MRKIFTLLTMCLLTMAAWGQTEITFIPGETYGNNETAQGADQMSKDGITVATTNGGLKAKEYRFAKSSVTTFTSEIGNIIKIEFTCTASGTEKYGPGCFAAQNGYSYEGNIGIWVGSSTSVSFTAETNQVRASKIVVTVDGGALAKPTISPAAGTYYGPINVTITCTTGGAKIYYTTNGNEPTTSSTQYTAPFTVNTNTTVKAISAKDGETSEVVSAVYEFGTATPVANIAAFQNAANDEVVVFQNPVSVLAQNRSYLYVKDNSGYALFYGQTDQTYKNGDVIPAGFAGTKTMYNGEPELKDITGLQPASSNSPIDPVIIGANQVGHGTFAQLVRLENITFTADGSNYTLTDANGNTCAVYFGTMGVSAPNDLSKAYNVNAIVGSYGRDNIVYQLLPVKIEPIGGGGDKFGWGSMADTPDNTNVTFDYESTIIWQSGRYLYAMDETGFGLAFGDLDHTYKFGDVIPAGFSGLKTTYKGEPELAAPLAGFQAPINKVKPTPEEITPAQVDKAHWAHYVVLRNVMINSAGTIITLNGVTCEMYNKTFNIPLPEDLSVPHTIYGVVGVFNNYQILPISFDKEPGDEGEEPIVDVANIMELYSLNNGRKGHFTTPLTTIFQSGPNLYVKDVDGNYSLAYGSVDYTEFVNGDLINDAVASWTIYNDFKQLLPVAETFVKAGHGTPVEPVIMPIEEVSQDMIHWYLGFENVTITPAEANYTYTMADETGEMIVYDKFHAFDNVDPSTLDYLEGFLTVYRGQLELYPVIMNHVVEFEPEDVNKDGEVNITDISLVIDSIISGKYFGDVDGNGEINITDINLIIARILR